MNPLYNLSPFVYSMGKTVRNQNHLPYTVSTECCNVFIFVTKGSITHQVDGRKRVLEKGSLEIIPPFFHQTISAHEKDDAEIFYIYFDLFERKDSASKTHRPSINEISQGELYFIDQPSYKNAGDSYDEVLRIVEALKESLASQDEWSFLERKKYMLELLLLFFRAHGEKEPDQKDFAAGHVARAIRYIEKNYADPKLCAKSVAKFTGLNTEYLSKLFDKQIHVSLSHYIRATRINRAKELFYLHQNIEKIALLCGFSSLPSFSRTFKHFCGTSPGEYRKEITGS